MDRPEVGDLVEYKSSSFDQSWFYKITDLSEECATAVTIAGPIGVGRTRSVPYHELVRESGNKWLWTIRRKTKLFDINEYFEKTKIILVFEDGYEDREETPPIVCADGFSMSVQAGRLCQCDPKDNHGSYKTVEVYYLSSIVPELEEYLVEYVQHDDPGSGIYGNVPVELINKIVNAHGGLAE
jgi:hypothetical protein